MSTQPTRGNRRHKDTERGRVTRDGGGYRKRHRHAEWDGMIEQANGDRKETSRPMVWHCLLADQ